MENTTNNGHHDDNHDDTEGNRQYYPKGWWVPLVGLVAVAFAFSIIAICLVNISGTDKWGKWKDTAKNKTEQVQTGNDENGGK